MISIDFIDKKVMFHYLMLFYRISTNAEVGDTVIKKGDL